MNDGNMVALGNIYVVICVGHFNFKLFVSFCLVLLPNAKAVSIEILASVV